MNSLLGRRQLNKSLCIATAVAVAVAAAPAATITTTATTTTATNFSNKNCCYFILIWPTSILADVQEALILNHRPQEAEPHRTMKTTTNTTYTKELHNNKSNNLTGQQQLQPIMQGNNQLPLQTRRSGLPRTISSERSSRFKIAPEERRYGDFEVEQGRILTATDDGPLNLCIIDKDAVLPVDKRYRSSSSSPRLHAYRQPPFFITFISIFELVTFLYYALRSDEPLTLIGPVPFESRLIYNPHRRYEVWRFLTYMFIHAGYWHISFNLLIQLAVGIPLELTHKFEPVFIIYMGGIIGGALGNSLADPHTYLAGASSGCYALIAAHLSNLIINWSEIKGACCRLITILLISSWDLGTAVFERHFRYGYQRPGRTSYGGHLAGALSGLLLGLVFLRNLRPLHWEAKLKKWALGIYLLLITFAITINLADPDYFPPPDTRNLVWTSNPFNFQREQ